MSDAPVAEGAATDGGAPPDVEHDGAPDAAQHPAAPTTPCPHCGEPLDAGARFCESCGADVSATPAAVEPPAALAPAVHEGTLLDDQTAAATDRARRSGVLVVDADLTAAPTACPACQGRIAADGYCEQCGTPAPKPRDHWSDAPARWVAGVCDRGIRHHRNEDAMALAAGDDPGGFAAVVVCDGVSNSTDSDRASLAAARAARDALIDGIRLDDPTAGLVAPRSGQDTAPLATPSRRTARAGELAARLVAAGAAAQEHAAKAAEGIPTGHNPPSCTFVAALVERPPGAVDPLAVVGWVGDSRAYWLPDDRPPLILSTDDSWAAEAIAQGVPREQAEHLPQAHAITRWLGLDAPDPVPRTAVQNLSTPGWLLVCSDGLWNYSSAAADMAALVAGTLAARAPDGPPAGDPLALADELTAWAVGQGGQDNITVALVRIDVPVDHAAGDTADSTAGQDSTTGIDSTTGDDSAGSGAPEGQG